MIPIFRFSPPTLSFYSKQNTKHKNKHSDTRIHTFANLIFITKINWYFCSSFSLFFLHCIVYKYRFPLYSWKKDFEQVMLHHCNMRTYQFSLSTNSSVIFRIIPVTNETSLSGISEKEDNLTRGASHSNKNSGTFEKVANETESSRKSFWKILKLVNFWTNPLMITSIKWNGNSRWEIFENLGIAREVVYFFGHPGKCCSIRKWKYPESKIGSFVCIESAPYCSPEKQHHKERNPTLSTK